MKQQGEKGSLFALYPPPFQNPKNQDFEKMKKNGGDIMIYTSVPKTTIIWGTVPEILSETDRIFCHFGPFFFNTPLTTRKIKILKQWKKHLEMSSRYTYVPKTTIIWCMFPEIWNTTEIIFCHFVSFFPL